MCVCSTYISCSCHLHFHLSVYIFLSWCLTYTRRLKIFYCDRTFSNNFISAITKNNDTYLIVRKTLKNSSYRGKYVRIIHNTGMRFQNKVGFKMVKYTSVSSYKSDENESMFYKVSWSEDIDQLEIKTRLPIITDFCL